MRVCRRGRERERERERERDRIPNSDLMNCKIMTRAKILSQTLNPLGSYILLFIMKFKRFMSLFFSDLSCSEQRQYIIPVFIGVMQERPMPFLDRAFSSQYY